MPDQTTTIIELPIADVVIGDRVRQDLGGLEGLAESLSRVGLLHPIVLNTNRELVSGLRRLRAAESNGWTTIPVRIMASLDNALNAIVAEQEENSLRKEMTISERAEFGRRLEAVERERARERQAHGQTAPNKNACGKLPQASEGKTRDKVGEAIGLSGSTYEKAKKVMEAAEAEPERFGDLPAQMDATGKVDPAFKELARRRHDEPAAEPDDEPDPEIYSDDQPEPDNNRAAFLVRADTAIRCAQFAGKPPKESVRVARRAAEVWTKLADQLESMRSGRKARNQ